MSVPAGFSLHLKSLHRLVATEHVLDGTCHHVVNAGMPIGRGRSFKEDIGGATFPFRHTFVKKVGLVPFFQDFFIDSVEVHTTAFGKFLAHIIV